MNPELAIAQPYAPPTPFSPPLNGELVPLDAQPAQPTQPTSSLQPSNIEPASAMVFSFTDLLEYGDCLEVILKLYDNSTPLTVREQQNSCFERVQAVYGSNGLSRANALQLISAADFYATTLLERALYPPRGQRARIASLFGFIYALDANDLHMRDLATKASTR